MWVARANVLVIRRLALRTMWERVRVRVCVCRVLVQFGALLTDDRPVQGQDCFCSSRQPENHIERFDLEAKAQHV